MNLKKITLEHGIYALVFGLAIGFRLLFLGAQPLSDLEADWALRAWMLSTGKLVDIGAQPAYVLLTSLLFFILDSNSALARLIPALAGGLLVIVPFFFRRYLGRVAAIILALVIALDPGFMAISRLALGQIMAVSFGLLALAAWINRKPVAAGISAGLAILSGPTLFAGVISFGLAWGIGKLLNLDERIRPLLPISDESPEAHRQDLRLGVLSGGGTLLLAGTLFFVFPEGLGGLAGVLPAYLSAWLSATGVPAARLPVALVVYHPIAVLFGLAGAVRAWTHKNAVDGFLIIWVATSLLLAWVSPGRQIVDLVWTLIPLLALAARELARAFRWPVAEVAADSHPADTAAEEPGGAWSGRPGREDLLVSAGLAALIVLFMAYIWMNLEAVARPLDATQSQVLRWQLMAIAMGLGIVSTVLIGLGWSRPVAARGLVWGLVIGLSLYGLATTWKMVDPTTTRVQEWWYPQPSTVQEKLLMTTLGDVSEGQTGRQDALAVVSNIDYPSLRWSLRDFPNARFESRVPAEEPPPAVITPGEDEPQLAATYRGADFLWRTSPAWTGSYPPEFLRWLVFREAPTLPEQLIFWARNDLFLEEVGAVGDGQDPLPIEPAPPETQP